MYSHNSYVSPLTTTICQQQVEQPSSLSEILLEDDCIYSRGEVSLNRLSICFVLFFSVKVVPSCLRPFCSVERYAGNDTRG
jgi:hypothetical protein